MSKIKLLNNEGPEPIFEKSGMKQEFRLSDIDGYLDILNAEKEELTKKAAQYQLSLDQLTNPELEISQKNWEEFMAYSNWRAQILIAQKRIKELEDDHADFKPAYDALSGRQKEDVAKWIGSVIVVEECTQDLDAVEKTIKEYLADKKLAESCLEETNQK